MTNHENDVNLLHLRAEVDAEITFVETIADPTDITDPDTEAYDIRLRVLRDAIEADAVYLENSRKDRPSLDTSPSSER